jgi:hypothetical protein
MTLAAIANMANVRTMKIASRTEIMTIRPYAPVIGQGYTVRLPGPAR